MLDDALQSALERWLTVAPATVREDSGEAVRWLTVCAYRFAIDSLRRRGKAADIDDAESMSAPPAESAESMSAHVDVERALREIANSFEQLVAIVFHDLYGFTYAEIAKELHCSERAAKQHHWRAINRLREIFSSDTLQRT